MQKDIFLNFEGDNWYKRNRLALQNSDVKNDVLLNEILLLLKDSSSEIKEPGLYSILEIGCGNGTRLKELVDLGFKVAGVDPSKDAINEARSRGIDAHVGTADSLPFPDNSFDIVIFGFCLYLCDREDLFLISAEADRALKKPGYMLIFDFYSKDQRANDYHHLEGIKSYKMDYSKLFDWHPDYLLVKQALGSHDGFLHTDNKDDLVSVSILRKT